MLEDPDSRAARRVRFPLEGERVAVRPFVAADAPAIHPVYADPEVMRFVGEGRSVELRDTEMLIDRCIEHQREHGFSFWAVVDRDRGCVIGDAGLFTRGSDVELGFTLGRAWWHQGCGQDAARLCLHAAATLELGPLIALVRPENLPSVRLLAKLGFTRTERVSAYGHVHDVYRQAVQHQLSPETHGCASGSSWLVVAVRRSRSVAQNVTRR